MPSPGCGVPCKGSARAMAYNVSICATDYLQCPSDMPRPPNLAPGIWIMTGLGLAQDGTLDETFHDPCVSELSVSAQEPRALPNSHDPALSLPTRCVNLVLVLQSHTPTPDSGLSTTESAPQTPSQLVSCRELGQQEAILSRFPICILVDRDRCHRRQAPACSNPGWNK